MLVEQRTLKNTILKIEIISKWKPYIFGAFLYAIKFPESYYPGKFDFLGHSHNLFHVFVVAASIIHLLGVLEWYYHAKLMICPK